MQRRFARLPDSSVLSAQLNALAAEADQLAERLRAAEAEQRRLGDESALRQAEQADADAATAAVRAGATAAAVGSPAKDKLIKKRAAILAEVDALAGAIVSVEDEMTREFTKLRDNAKLSGQAKVTACATKYEHAIGALLAAHREFVEARSLVDYIERAARAHSALRQPLWWNDEASDQGVLMPSAPGRPEPGPRLTFQAALMIVTADLTNFEKG
jgi:hypothetical protein